MLQWCVHDMNVLPHVLTGGSTYIHSYNMNVCVPHDTFHVVVVPWLKKWSEYMNVHTYMTCMYVMCTFNFDDI